MNCPQENRQKIGKLNLFCDKIKNRGEEENKKMEFPGRWKENPRTILQQGKNKKRNSRNHEIVCKYDKIMDTLIKVKKF